MSHILLSSSSRRRHQPKKLVLALSKCCWWGVNINSFISVGSFTPPPTGRPQIRMNMIAMDRSPWASLTLTHHARNSRAFTTIPSRTFTTSTTTTTTTTTSIHMNNNNHDNYEESMLPLDFPRRNDVLTALEAVQKACEITLQNQPENDYNNNNIDTVQKSDLSPVTLADFAVQAVVLQHLNHTFDGMDGFIAEENSAALQEDEELSRNIFEATQPFMKNVNQLMQSIDLGTDYLKWYDSDKEISTSQRPERVWVLDPIDGTKGFLRGKRNGGQYCIALALLEKGVPTIGILGCPNLPTKSCATDGYAWSKEESSENNRQSRGCIFVASQGGGCYQLPMYNNYNNNDEENNPPLVPLKVTSNQNESNRAISKARFCIGVEKGFGDPLGQCISMAQILHGKDKALDDNGDIVQSQRMDSQAKFGVIGRGDAEFYVRLPKPGYREYIWDQAAGNVVLQESGGLMTDQDGNPIDFSLGPKLSKQVKGVLGSNGGIFHTALVNAYKEQEKERTK